jgi:hypothetical protein
MQFNKSKSEEADMNVIFKAGMPCDFFALILIGRVHVEVGKEKLVFEGGPFMYFGIQALQGKWQGFIQRGDGGINPHLLDRGGYPPSVCQALFFENSVLKEMAMCQLFKMNRSIQMVRRFFFLPCLAH